MTYASKTLAHDPALSRTTRDIASEAKQTAHSSPQLGHESGNISPITLVKNSYEMSTSTGMSSSSAPFQKRLVTLDSDGRDASTHDANATNVGEDDVEIVGYGHKSGPKRGHKSGHESGHKPCHKRRTPVIIDLSSEDENNPGRNWSRFMESNDSKDQEVPIVISDEHLTNKTKQKIIKSKKRKRSFW